MLQILSLNLTASQPSFRRRHIFSLKGNQSKLHDDIKLYFQEQFSRNFRDSIYDYYESVDGGHGRIEIRRYCTTSDIDWLQGRENWKNLNTICMVDRERQFDEKTEKKQAITLAA